MDKRFPIEDQVEMLGWALKGRIVTPGETDYDSVRELSVHNFDLKPAGVVRPVNAADVAATVNFASAADLPISVRSGGHSPFSSNQGGIVIDLRDLNQIEIDVANKTAWAGTGLTAGEVTMAVEKHGLIVGFGDTASVGIGGLVTGGGIGYLIRKYGLTIDSLLAAEIVTANGDIVIADADHSPDLFWAVRGGSGNFGVVTRMKFQLHAMPQFTGGPLVLPATPQTLAGFVAASFAAPEELSTIGMVMPCPPLPFLPAEMHGKLVLIGMLAYAGAPGAAQDAIAPFRALGTPIADGVRRAPYSSMYLPEPPVKFAVSIRSRFAKTIGIAEATKIIADLERCPAPMKMAQLRVLGGAASRVPSDATAFAHRDAKMLVAFLAMYPRGEAAMAGFDKWASESLDGIAPDNTAGTYVNFLGAEGETGVAAAYPPATMERLRQIKAIYDPENLFRLNQNILPAS